MDKPLVLDTDAEGSGGLGAVLCDGASAEWISCSTPSSFAEALMPRKTQIYPLEVLAAAVALRVWRRRLAHRHLVLFVDNTSALSSLRRGSSRQVDVHSLITQVWDDLYDSGFYGIRVLWVPSKLNLADSPSRSLTPATGSRIAARIRWETLIAAVSVRL